MRIVSNHDTYTWRYGWRNDPEFQGQVREGNPVGTPNPEGFPSDLAAVTRRKLVQINAAAALADLSIPPGNRLETLKGNLRGWHSIRINDQWRIVFRWTDAGAEDVDIIDYH